MTKKIYVTVAEFLENGGELKVGRKLYEPSIECFGDFIYCFSIPDRDYRISDMGKYNYHVEIDCNPIYK